MDLGISSYGFGFAAGVLSTLSPCVLPIVPILLASSMHAHRNAPLALAAGLAVSFGVMGTTLAWAGASLGVDASIFRAVTAAVLGLFGLVLVSANLQHQLAAMTSGIGDFGNAALSKLPLDGLGGQFVVGLGLGIVWSPCVGPTLGAAVVLASRGSHLAQVAALMATFGVGAALPVLALARISHGAVARTRPALLRAGKTGRIVFGTVLMALSVSILSGADKTLEAWLVDHSPAWLTELTTRF